MMDELFNMNISIASALHLPGFGEEDVMLADLPDEMKFGLNNIVVISIYSNLIIISLLGNFIVLRKLYGRKNRSRVHFMLLHLCVADILVTVFNMPLMIGWKSTVQWMAGELMCRFLMFARVVGIYLNAFLLISISIDRLCSVWDPMSTVRKATMRAKAMVLLCWLLSLVCASPQLTLWNLKTHPLHSWYHQCVTFGNFYSESAELAYGIWVTTLMYGLPLVIILSCYFGIWWRISQYSRQTRQKDPSVVSATPVTRARMSIAESRVLLRGVHQDYLSKAKSRTLKMTALVVTIFITCWSPYQLIHMWYYIDRTSATKVNLLLQEILFIFGVFSSVIDPYVYGLYSMGIWNEIDVFSVASCVQRRNVHKDGKRTSFVAMDAITTTGRNGTLNPVTKTLIQSLDSSEKTLVIKPVAKLSQ